MPFGGSGEQCHTVRTAPYDYIVTRSQSLLQRVVGSKYFVCLCSLDGQDVLRQFIGFNDKTLMQIPCILP